MFHVRCIPAGKLLFKEQEKLRAGWRHQFGREQLKSAKKETTSLQIPKHSSSGQWNYSGQRKGLWIFPRSHGTRGTGKFQLPTRDRSQEGRSAESLLPGKGQSVLPATSLSPHNSTWEYRNSPTMAKSTEEINSSPPLRACSYRLSHSEYLFLCFLLQDRTILQNHLCGEKRHELLPLQQMTSYRHAGFTPASVFHRDDTSLLGE